MSLALTRWFPGHIKPARPGVYLLEGGRSNVTGYQYWDGTAWGVWNESATIANEIRRHCAPAYQNDRWRGLRTQPCPVFTPSPLSDSEINRQLAKKLGWYSVWASTTGYALVGMSGKGYDYTFHYNDWSVAGPIAQYLYCFPRLRNGLWFTSQRGIDYEAETPQKCIALAAIGIME